MQATGIQPTALRSRVSWAPALGWLARQQRQRRWQLGQPRPLPEPALQPTPRPELPALPPLPAAKGEAMNRLLSKLDGMPVYLLWGEKVGQGGLTG